MQKKLIYDDGVIRSEYRFIDDIVEIVNKDYETGDEHTVCIGIWELRNIIADFDMQDEVVNEQ